MHDSSPQKRKTKSEETKEATGQTKGNGQETKNICTGADDPPTPTTANPSENSPLGVYLYRKAMAQELRKERQVDLEALRGVLGEYLGCYLFIGYDLSHEPVVYVNAPDQMAADALSAALNRFFYASKNQIPKNGDEDGGNPFLNR